MSAYDGGYSGTTYGGGGGDDGGGFVWGSQGGSQSAAKTVVDESLRPVTVKQIIDGETAFTGDSSFRIDGADVKQVTLVGMVRAISPQTTNTTYKLDDGTGIIEVKLWIDADKVESGAAATTGTFGVGDYVRVWGRLKSYNNKRHVGAHVIKPVRDFNEVNYHLLEATYVHLYFTRGGAPDAGGNAGHNNDNSNNDSMFVDDGGNNNGSNDARYKGYSAKARRMYDFLQRSGNPSDGIHMQHISRESGMSIQDVMAAAEELLNHGTIYTTMDDETYAILDH